MSKRTSAVLERPASDVVQGSPIALQVALLDNTLKQALATLFETNERAQRFANVLHEIAAREDIPADVRVLIARTLEA